MQTCVVPKFKVKINLLGSLQPKGRRSFLLQHCGKHNPLLPVSLPLTTRAWHRMLMNTANRGVAR